jgi:hypothetical protein
MERDNSRRLMLLQTLRTRDFAQHGGGGSRCLHVVDRRLSVIELATPGFASPRVRALAPSPSDSRRRPLHLTIGRKVRLEVVS